MKLLFVYLDWTLEDVPRCFYVGKGDERRVKKRDRNEFWKHTAAKYGWRREVVLTTKDSKFVENQEREWIVRMGTYHHDRSDGWGCNFTRGGDVGGAHFGHPHSEATKAVLSQKLRGNKNCVGTKASPQRIAKTSGPNHHSYGKKQSATALAKNSAANHGENNAQAKLTWDKVRSIRARFTSSETTKSQLAKEHDVSTTLIHYITIGKLWKEQANDQVR